MTTGQLPQPAPRNQAGRQLAAVAAGFTGHNIRTHLSRIGDVPVLTIEEPTGGPDPTTISVTPDLSDPGLPLECTCLWTPPPGATPQAIAHTMIAVLHALRPEPLRIVPPAITRLPDDSRTRRGKASPAAMT